MGRAKPKRNYSVSFSESDAPALSERNLTLLLDDLTLDRRKHPVRCEAFRLALIQKIRTYQSWKKLINEVPSMSEQLAELKQLKSKLQPALEELLVLSNLPRKRLTHAYIDADITGFGNLDDRINGATGDLAVLLGALNQVERNWNNSRRGRGPEPVHTLIQDLAECFKEYDADDHDDETARRSARDAFIRHALKAFRIRHPKRFDDILCRRVHFSEQ